jgi:hypothetical protein
MRLRYTLAVAAVAAASSLVFALPSGATVHEIVGQWCSGQGDLAPPGISDATKPNFARPLFASGVATRVPNGAGPGTVLVQFNFDHPAIKVVSAGAPVLLFGNVWITPWTTNDDFPAFQHCPGYVGGSGP